MRNFTRMAVAVVMVVVTACGGVTLPAEIDGGFDLDLEALLEDLGNCDVLSDTFVGVVREAAEDLDKIAESTGGMVPAVELANRVDVLTENAYFAIAEKLGCNAVSQRLETIERLRNLSPDSAAGDDLITDVIEHLQTSE